MTQAAILEPAPAAPNALALIETTKPLELFSNNGLDPILTKIEEEARSTVLDISTEKGRKEIASLAHKIARSKTALDKAGKDLVSGWKERAKLVDAERARAWDRLEALQKEIRAPLTQWENTEKERVAAHEAVLAAIPEHPGYGQQETAKEIAKRLAHLESYPARDWQEFTARATKTLADEIERTKGLLAIAEKREAEQAELARLRQEEADRRQREHEQRLKAEAAAKAKAEAEEKARREAEAEAARVRAEQEKAERERRRIQQEKEEAERERAEAVARARQAEDDRLAAIAQAQADKKAADEKAERDRIAAEEKAKRDAEAAAKAERDRIEAERKKEAEAAVAREADKRHRAKVNNEALNGIVTTCNTDELDVTVEIARAVVEAIARGLVPHVKISY